MTKKILTGTVVSKKQSKTAIVLVERKFRHPLYEKVLTRSKRYAVHDEKDACRIGDMVRIQESRPISKTKHFVLLGIVSAAAQEIKSS